MTTIPAPRRAPPEPRDLRFDLSDVPRFWFGGRKSVTLFMDNLSVFFPAGERFFVASVKAFQDQVTDPALAAEMKAFCVQEGHHSREHVRYNKMLADKGYPVERMERRLETFLRGLTRRASKKRRLAVTCALEHFTSLLASLVLEDSRVLEGAHPEMAALWRWHAAEESEHKAVAFDVYKAAGGSTLRRGAAMGVTTLIFWGWILLHQIQLMRVEGLLWSPREWFQLGHFLLARPAATWRLAWPYLRYYSPGFHPWEHDTQPLLDRWKAEALPATTASDRVG